MTEMTTLYPDDRSAGHLYHFLNAVIAPRPIAWVSSLSPSGHLNLAPHSYTTVVSPNPPMVCFVSIGRKDSLNNIEATRQFVYNIGGRHLVERINRTAYKPYMKNHVLLYRDAILGQDPTNVERVMLRIR